MTRDEQKYHREANKQLELAIKTTRKNADFKR